MSLPRRYRWFIAAAGITLAFAVVSLAVHKSATLAAFADYADLVLLLLAAGVTLANALKRPKVERAFWALMTLGFLLWLTNEAGWTIWESVLHRQVPDPIFFDIILFIHTVPMIAAVGWRPDLLKKEGRILIGLLEFLMLLGWWIFLYAFTVFPHQYVVLNQRLYNLYYDQLYGVENAVLLAVLGLSVLTSSGGWRRLYLHFLAASALYAVNSQFLDRAAANNVYYRGASMMSR